MSDLTLPITDEQLQGTIYKKGVNYQGRGAKQSPEVTVPYIHDYRPLKPYPTDGASLYVGTNAGNFTMKPDPDKPGDANLHCAYNTVVGTQAGRGFRTAYNCTALGVNALRKLEHGHSNVAAGRDAGHELKFGNYNVLQGRAAGYNITEGHYNTLIGPQAGMGLKEGSGNTVVGKFTLDAGVTGEVVIADGGGNAVIRPRIVEFLDTELIENPASPERITLHMGDVRNWAITLTGNRTLWTPVGAKPGTEGKIFVNGNHALRATRHWRGVSPTLHIGGGAETMLSYFVRAPDRIIITQVTQV
jgi:hypothetical protein